MAVSDSSPHEDGFDGAKYFKGVESGSVVEHVFTIQNDTDKAVYRRVTTEFHIFSKMPSAESAAARHVQIGKANRCKGQKPRQEPVFQFALDRWPLIR